MAKRRQVTCEECGRRFTPGSIIYHYDRKSRRYTCNSCYRRLYGKQTHILGQKAWAFALKVFFGLMFVLVAFSPDKAKEDWLSTSILGIVIGLGLFAWAAIPVIKEKQYRREQEEYSEALRRKIENQTTVCSHCGATTKGDVCEYCGSPLR